MANPLSMFEQMMNRNGPIQESVMRNLTHWDFRNLQLAGVRIPVSRGIQRKFLKPNRCNERDPESRFEQCTNTTRSIDEVRACVGRPSWFSRGKFRFEKWIGDQEIQPCLQTERYPAPESNPENEPNMGGCPIHSKVCRRCRDFYAARQLNEQLSIIGQFCTLLCKRHSLEHANQFPLNACRCHGYMNDNWRCNRCATDTIGYLDARAGMFGISLMQAKIPWYHPLARLRSLWGSRGSRCPIEGCVRQPWLDGGNRARMQMCLGCNSITRM